MSELNQAIIQKEDLPNCIPPKSEKIDPKRHQKRIDFRIDYFCHSEAVWNTKMWSSRAHVDG